MDSNSEKKQQDSTAINISSPAQDSQQATMATTTPTTALDSAHDRTEMQVKGKVGLTKEELMEYADAPFWVRLRNILFASFWLVWLAAIVVAIGYVVTTPNCVKKSS